MFGAIENGEMVLNDAGKMIVGWYYELENKYPDKQCHEMVVMPNHFHCIIENVDGVRELNGHIRESGAHVGAPDIQRTHWHCH
jgi:REP element-mobilizing transposase RayT